MPHHRVRRRRGRLPRGEDRGGGGRPDAEDDRSAHGIIDSGVAEIPDLAGKVDERWTVTRRGALVRDRGANDSFGHGTAVASLVAANVGDGFGMAGFGGAAHLVVVRPGR